METQTSQQRLQYLLAWSPNSNLAWTSAWDRNSILAWIPAWIWDSKSLDLFGNLRGFFGDFWEARIRLSGQNQTKLSEGVAARAKPISFFPKSNLT
mmetsp:Transcript_47741/g.102321  ORF Transcript_47741/g.102321 Transcript_47741/m.102321 type:complete len:96 (+) Transcript_47741:235-522(+)